MTIVDQVKVYQDTHLAGMPWEAGRIGSTTYQHLRKVELIVERSEENIQWHWKGRFLWSPDARTPWDTLPDFLGFLGMEPQAAKGTAPSVEALVSRECGVFDMEFMRLMLNAQYCNHYFKLHGQAPYYVPSDRNKSIRKYPVPEGTCCPQCGQTTRQYAFPRQTGIGFTCKWCKKTYGYTAIGAERVRVASVRQDCLDALQAGASPEQVALEYQVSRATLSNWKRGKGNS